VDLMGFGRSGRPAGFDYTVEGHARALDSLLAELDLPRVCLFGHSMGGAVALSLAALEPERVAGVILAEANLDAGGGEASQEIAAQTAGQFAREGYAKLCRTVQAEGNPWAQTLRLASPEALHAGAVSLVAGVDPAWRDILYGLTCPRFFVFGERSLPDADFGELPRHGVEVVTIPDCGHNMAWENAGGLADGIGHCLASTF
jgi:pimeloyl-ACP methyl ester carboxylesterase